MKYSKNEYKELLSKYGVEETRQPGNEKKHFLKLKYIEKYESKFGKKVWFPTSEITSRHFLRMVQYDEGKAIHISSGDFYYKMVAGIMEIPWLLLRFDPWSDVIVDNIYYCFEQEGWHGINGFCILAFDFTTAISSQEIGRIDEGKELVYFCNGLIFRSDGSYKYIHRAFTDPKEWGPGYRRFGPSRSSGEMKVISNSWHGRNDFGIPTYYIFDDSKNKLDDRLLKINQRAGFPKRGELINASWMHNPGRRFSHDLFNPATEYSIYNEDLDPLYNKIFEVT
jgi:hypothetical protein